MTCIAAIRDKGTVWMGGDSAGVGDLNISTRSDKKVFIKSDIIGNEFAFGFTSSFRMGQLLQYTLVVPPVTEGVDLHEYMATTFVSAVRACLKDGGYSTITNNEESGGVFLVGVRGRLFKIDSDYQVGEDIQPFAAVGCGQDLALGSLYSTANLNMECSGRITLSLESAQEFSAGVRAPFNVIKVPTK